MATRNCFPCTACCEGWVGSKHIAMKPGEPCVHCTKQGCAIYENRPVEPCVNFKCGWLMEQSPLPEHMKPNECGAIVLFDKKWNGRKIIAAIPVGKCIPSATLEWLMAYSRKHSIPLLFKENLKKDGNFVGYKQVGYGPPSFIHAVEAKLGPEDIMMI